MGAESVGHKLLYEIGPISEVSYKWIFLFQFEGKRSITLLPQGSSWSLVIILSTSHCNKVGKGPFLFRTPNAGSYTHWIKSYWCVIYQSTILSNKQMLTILILIMSVEFYKITKLHLISSISELATVSIIYSRDPGSNLGVDSVCVTF
jgi:hypothetical protein